MIGYVSLVYSGVPARRAVGRVIQTKAWERGIVTVVVGGTDICFSVETGYDVGRGVLTADEPSGDLPPVHTGWRLTEESRRALEAEWRAREAAGKKRRRGA